MDYKIVEGKLVLLERVCVINENNCTDKTST